MWPVEEAGNPSLAGFISNHHNTNIENIYAMTRRGDYHATVISQHFKRYTVTLHLYMSAY
jgi:hypothetical protein